MKKLLALSLVLLFMGSQAFAICGCACMIKAERLNGISPIIYYIVDKYGNLRGWQPWDSFTPVSDGDLVTLVYPPGSGNSTYCDIIMMGYTLCPASTPPLVYFTECEIPPEAYQATFRIHADCLNSQFSISLVSASPIGQPPPQ
jgi:hypothetical protein